jgi:hypothetical protein
VIPWPAASSVASGPADLPPGAELPAVPLVGSDKYIITVVIEKL